MNFLKIIAVGMIILGAVGFGHADVIHNTLTPDLDYGGDWLITNEDEGSEAAGKFIVSGNDYYLDSIEMRIKDKDAMHSDAICLRIAGHDPMNNVPNDTEILSETCFSDGDFISNTYDNFTFDPAAAPPVLYAGNTYWLVASVLDETSPFTYYWTTNTSYPVAFQLALRTALGTWGDISFRPLAFQITGTVVPIPGTIALLASGLIGIVVFRKKFRKS